MGGEGARAKPPLPPLSGMGLCQPHPGFKIIVSAIIS